MGLNKRGKRCIIKYNVSICQKMRAFVSLTVIQKECGIMKRILNKTKVNLIVFLMFAVFFMETVTVLFTSGFANGGFFLRCYSHWWLHLVYGLYVHFLSLKKCGLLQ